MLPPETHSTGGLATAVDLGTERRAETEILSAAAFNYGGVVQNAKTARDNTKETCNAKRLMRTYLSLPTECHDYQFVRRGHYSTPASPSQPAKERNLD